MASSMDRGQFLPGQELAPVNPGVEAVGFKRVAKPLDGTRVFPNVSQENGRCGAPNETVAPFALRAKRTQSVDNYRLSFSQALAHDAVDLPGR